MDYDVWALLFTRGEPDFLINGLESVEITGPVIHLHGQAIDLSRKRAVERVEQLSVDVAGIAPPIEQVEHHFQALEQR